MENVLQAWLANLSPENRTLVDRLRGIVVAATLEDLIRRRVAANRQA